ncbi:MAG: hypothetical protein K8R57_07000 [Verrucomicrobia bacterium]|nr:hypothetical protein [Verrucomicrobiota bacterium]
MKITTSILVIPAITLLLASLPAQLHAAPDNGSATTQRIALGAPSLRYKMISGYKQPFNDDLQLHLSKGWTPVGGVSVTTWNNDLFFAQILSKPTSSE